MVRLSGGWKLGLGCGIFFGMLGFGFGLIAGVGGWMAGLMCGLFAGTVTTITLGILFHNLDESYRNEPNEADIVAVFYKHKNQKLTEKQVANMFDSQYIGTVGGLCDRLFEYEILCRDEQLHATNKRRFKTEYMYWLNNDKMALVEKMLKTPYQKGYRKTEEKMDKTLIRKRRLKILEN